MSDSSHSQIRFWNSEWLPPATRSGHQRALKVHFPLFFRCAAASGKISAHGSVSGSQCEWQLTIQFFSSSCHGCAILSGSEFYLLGTWDVPLWSTCHWSWCLDGSFPTFLNLAEGIIIITCNNIPINTLLPRAYTPSTPPTTPKQWSPSQTTLQTYFLNSEGTVTKLCYYIFEMDKRWISFDLLIN